MQASRTLSQYIKDLIYGANDGIITTFAVVASVVGAGLDAAVILIVGFASLVADGLSMAASDYLASKSERGVREARGETGGMGAAEERPEVAAAFTFLAFVIAGSLPLLPYALVPGTPKLFLMAGAVAALSLVLIGAIRTMATGGSALRGAAEMLLVGGAAMTVAFFIGRYVASLT